MMISLMVSMSSGSCSVSNRFLKSNWNSIFFDPICGVSTLGHNFYFLTLCPVGVAHSHSVVTSNPLG